MKTHRFSALFTLSAFSLASATAQVDDITVQKPQTTIFLRPYRAPQISPPAMTNSRRLEALLRAGKLYLTVQDAIALAIENNLDLQIDRYGPLQAAWAVERANAGGPLRGVPAGNTQVGRVAAGQGVTGTEALVGVNNGGGATSTASGSAVVSQIGPVTPNLDPTLQSSTIFSHLTYPQVNTIVSGTSSLVSTQRGYYNTLQQGLITGGIVRYSDNESFSRESTPTDVLDPSVAPSMQFYIQHPFLQGFGVGLNSRFIRIAKNNVIAARGTFEAQLLNLVANVLNLYWDLVSDLDDLKGRQEALDFAQKFLQDTTAEIKLGVLSGVDIYSPQAEVAARRQDLIIAQAALQQQEILLKNALSRDGIADPAIEDVSIVPLDHIQVPETDDVPPLRQLVATALKKRSDIAVSELNARTAEISTEGTANVLLPSLTGLASETLNGLAGAPVPSAGQVDPYFVGGYGTAAAQLLRRNFPTNRAAAQLSGQVLVDHIDNGDYGFEQLQLRQTQLLTRRDMNQLVVDISNQTVALRQARARYKAAVDALQLQQELLKGEQAKFSLGTSTTAAVIVAQRSLIAAQSAEGAALTAYVHARISLDQVLGETLEKNHVSIEEGLNGRVARQSTIPPGAAAAPDGR